MTTITKFYHEARELDELNEDIMSLQIHADYLEHCVNRWEKCLATRPYINGGRPLPGSDYSHEEYIYALEQVDEYRMRWHAALREMEVLQASRKKYYGF